MLGCTKGAKTEEQIIQLYLHTFIATTGSPANEEMTQKERVLARIKEVGYADNFWAIENNMLRLGATIFDLSHDGMKFRGVFGKELGKERRFHKNFYYFPEKPEKTDAMVKERVAKILHDTPPYETKVKGNSLF